MNESHQTVYYVDHVKDRIQEALLIEGTPQNGWVEFKIAGLLHPFNLPVDHTTCAETLEDAEWLLGVHLAEERDQSLRMAGYLQDRVDELFKKPHMQERWAEIEKERANA
jgi:hypothetical protein